jgi:hypothetical protein
MSEQVGFQAKPVVRKPYIKPEIIHELKLETCVGSPIGAPPLDPTNPFLPPQ